MPTPCHIYVCVCVCVFRYGLPCKASLVGYVLCWQAPLFNLVNYLRTDPLSLMSVQTRHYPKLQRGSCNQKSTLGNPHT